MSMDVATSIKIYRKTMNGLLRQIEQSLRDEQKEGCYALVKLRFVPNEANGG